MRKAARVENKGEMHRRVIDVTQAWEYGKENRMELEQVEAVVNAAVAKQAVFDVHTHLYPPAFGTPLRGDPGGCLLWGVDELLTYHYLIAETFRVRRPGDPDPAAFWAWDKRRQAQLVWQRLFVDRTPLSEACRGVVTVLGAFGVDPGERSLEKIRKKLEEGTPEAQIDRVFELAGVEALTMTNNVFDDNERQRWLANPRVGEDPRFGAVLRIDPMLVDWPAAAGWLGAWGYDVGEKVGGRTIEEGRRFLRDWIGRMKARYVAVSLPPEWRYPAEGGAKEQAGVEMLDRVVLPVCRELGLSLALMIGSKRQVNPALRDGGDAVGLADVSSLMRLCAAYPENRFLVTMLARENQHALAVAARKFSNLMIFGCWWFLNTPSLIDEITRMRLELLGSSFIPQHSDARVLEQLIYKWRHSRHVLARVLADQYRVLIAAGWHVNEADIRQDVQRLLNGNARGQVQAS